MGLGVRGTLPITNVVDGKLGIFGTPDQWILASDIETLVIA